MLHKNDATTLFPLTFSAAQHASFTNGFTALQRFLLRPSTRAYPRSSSSPLRCFHDDGSDEELFYPGVQALSGIGKDRNEEVALRYLHLAAEKEYPPAQTRIGIFYRDGKCGFAQDHTKAVEWWKSGPEKNYFTAQVCLGTAFYTGNGVHQNYAIAWKWFHLAAEQGNASAQFNIGSMFCNGNGVKQDYEESLKWFRLAAEQGNASAQFNIGAMFYNGNGVKQDYEESLKWFRLAADQKIAVAQFYLGLIFSMGWGVKQDFSEAFKWFHRAAEQKNTNACFNLGSIYYSGNGVARDYTEALKWLRIAAAEEHPHAQYMLGIMYFDHLHDQKKSMKWFRRAAKQGVTYPQSKLIGVRSLLFSYKPTTDDFHAHYDFAMMNHDSPALQKLCARDANLFCEALQNDTLLTTDECYEWVKYLFEHHFLQIDLHFQLYLAEKIYFHGPITDEIALKLIRRFHFYYPEDKDRYIETMRLLWNLAQLIDPKGYLVQYYLYKYLEKKPEDKYL